MRARTACRTSSSLICSPTLETVTAARCPDTVTGWRMVEVEVEVVSRKTQLMPPTSVFLTLALCLALCMLKVWLRLARDLPSVLQHYYCNLFRNYRKYFF